MLGVLFFFGVSMPVALNATASSPPKLGFGVDEVLHQINHLMPWSFDFGGSLFCKSMQSVVAFVRELSFGVIGFTDYHRARPLHPYSSSLPKTFFLLQVGLQSGADLLCYGNTALDKALTVATNLVFVVARTFLMLPVLFNRLESLTFYNPTLISSFVGYWHNLWRKELHRHFYSNISQANLQQNALS